MSVRLGVGAVLVVHQTPVGRVGPDALRHEETLSLFGRLARHGPPHGPHLTCLDRVLKQREGRYSRGRKKGKYGEESRQEDGRIERGDSRYVCALYFQADPVRMGQPR